MANQNFLNDLRKSYLDWVEEFSQCKIGSFYYYTAAGNRVDIVVGENSATATLNGNAQIEFNFEDLKKPVEEVKLQELGHKKIKLMQSLKPIVAITDEEFSERKVERIYNHVQHICRRFESGKVSKLISLKRINVGSEIAPEFHQCIVLDNVLPNWVIDPRYESLAKICASNKYGFKLITKRDLQENLREPVDLAFIAEQLNEIAKDSKHNKDLLP